MKPDTLFAERKLAVLLLRKGEEVKNVAEELGRSEVWVRKWWQRYHQEGFRGLQDRSRAPKKHGGKLPAEVVEKICLARNELEAEKELGIGLKYIGPLAIRTRLKKWDVKPLPSTASIERTLRKHKLTNSKEENVEEKVDYPQLQPQRSQELVQVDIVPHHLTGGEKAPCFNAIDVVSRYPTGRAYIRRRSQDACDFLCHVWQELGVPTYTQVDNEGCFSGGNTHPHVLGKVVRLALVVGTELVFSPFYHPQSNAFVERFHQDYNLHVWDNTYLESHQAINDQAEHFYQLYRQRLDHSAIEGESPDQLHGKPMRRLEPAFKPKHPLPLRTGKIHFMRRVDSQGNIKVLNAAWTVPEFDLTTGVWATLDIQVSGATLFIYDAAPDVKGRRQIASHPFQIDEPILPWSEQDAPLNENLTATTVSPHVSSEQLSSLQTPTIVDDLIQTGQDILQAAFTLSAHFTGQLFNTMY